MKKFLLTVIIVLSFAKSNAQEVGNLYLGAYYNYYHFKAHFAIKDYFNIAFIPDEYQYLGSIITQQNYVGLDFNWVFSKSKKRNNFRTMGAQLGFCTQAVRTQPSYTSTQESYIFPVLQGSFYINAERKLFSKTINKNGHEHLLNVYWILPEIGFFAQSNHWRINNRVVKHQLATQFGSGFSAYFNNYRFKFLAGIINTDLLNDQVNHFSRISRFDYPYMITASFCKKF